MKHCVPCFQITDIHNGSKASKCVFLSNNRVFTTGFARTSARQYAVWDIVSVCMCVVSGQYAVWDIVSVCMCVVSGCLYVCG